MRVSRAEGPPVAAGRAEAPPVAAGRAEARLVAGSQAEAVRHGRAAQNNSVVEPLPCNPRRGPDLT